MSPKVGTVMGKFSLVAGARQEQVTNMAAVKPAYGILRKRKKDSLYILLEVTGDPAGRERIYRELIRIIGEEYFQAPGSVTAKLRHALGAANSFLLQENLRALPHDQRAGAVTCTVLREGSVYIAQAGPVAAHVSYRGKLTSFPEKPLTELTAEEATPLGFKKGMPIRFYRSKVGVGDAILLTSGSLAEQASPKQIAQAIAGRNIEPALANLEELADEGDTSAMLIRVVPLEGSPGAKPQAAVQRPVRPRVREEHLQERPARPRVSETPREVPEEQLARPRVSEAPREVPEEQLAQPRVSEILQEQPAGPSVREEDLREQPARPKVSEILQERLPHPDWDSLGHRVSSLLTRALKGVGDFLKRLLPERATDQPKGHRNPWKGIAIAIPIIVVILMVFVYWQRALARRDRFGELVVQAQQQIALVAQVDEATARGHLLEALDSLAEAEGLFPGNPQVNGLREQTDDLLKQIDKVTILGWISPLWEYGEEGSDPSRVIVANNIDIYVLDKGLDRVYKHLLDDTMQVLQQLEVEPVLLRKGDQRDPIVVGELVDMVWAKAEGGRLRSNLLVLESGGSLLEYDPEGGIDVLPAGGSDRWMQPLIAGSYGGDFYLLDVGLSQVLRYEPYYGDLPEGYFPTAGEVDLAGAADMAMDGYVYILYADGRVLKFLNGQPVAFAITGLYEPLQNPTALFTNAESEFLYVADAGNNRIVQLTKEGSLLQQFKADQDGVFDELKGLFAVEKYDLLYFVSDNRLYVTRMPSE